MRFVRRGQIVWTLVVVAGAIAVGAIWMMNHPSAPEDSRQTIVFWGSTNVGEDVYTLIRRFEQTNPQYRVILATSAARDIVGDAQRLLCATAGGVPPDLVWFDRFAIGEWASRGALTNLTPMIEQQPKDDPLRIDLSQYYEFTIQEASYRKPGTSDVPGLYGLPTVADCRVLYTNGDLLRQEGIVNASGEPQPPETWDELRQQANRLTRYNNPADKRQGLKRLGFAPNFGNSWLYIYAWQAGGELMNADRTRVTMDSPPVVRALRYMTDVYDDLGGFGQVEGFRESFQGGGLDPFIRSQVAMKIDGSPYLNTLADWKREMDFIVTPAPMPADELAPPRGRKPITWSGGFALVIPTTAKNKTGAFKLMQYMYSWEGVQLIQQGKREQKEAEGKLYLPEQLANRVFYTRLVAETIDKNPNVPKRFKQAYAVIDELMPRTLIRPVTPVGQLLWNQHIRAYDAAVNHSLREEARKAGVDEVQFCLARMQTDVQRSLDEILQPLPPTVVDWKPYLAGYALVLIAPFVAMYFLYKRRRREYGYKAREVGAAMVFASPWLVGFAVFVGGPILFSIVFSFTRYDVLSPARYVGIANYLDVFSDPVFYRSLGNTLFMILRIPLGMAVSLGIAMLLNNAVRGIGAYRTGFYLPAIMPLVAASLMWVWIFNPTVGLLNSVIGWLISLPPVQWAEGLLGLQFSLPLWLKDPSWSKPSLVLMSLWTAGAGMIIWLAGLQSIPPQLYEAASVDGANAWRRFRHITIPMLSPYILFNCIIGFIGTMKMWEEAYIMTEGGPADSTLFYAYYLFRQAFQYFRFGQASAMAWVLFVIVLALTLAQLWLSRRWVHYEQA